MAALKIAHTAAPDTKTRYGLSRLKKGNRFASYIQKPASHMARAADDAVVWTAASTACPSRSAMTIRPLMVAAARGKVFSSRGRAYPVLKKS